MRERREAFLTATVVSVRGSGYRRAGARMLASHEQWLAGSISGGCLEREIATRGFWLTRERPAVLLCFDANDVLDERVGSGCQGVVEVLLERHEPHDTTAGDLWCAVERCLREEQSAVSVSVFRSTREDVSVGSRYIAQASGHYDGNRNPDTLHDAFGREAQRALAELEIKAPYIATHTSSAGELHVLVERIAPPPHLFVFGAGHDVSPLVSMAKPLGWSVTVWDALPRSSTRERFLSADAYLSGELAVALEQLERCVWPAAVVMGHHLDHDRAALAGLLRSRARYVGVLGPRRRSEQLLADIGRASDSLDAGSLARVYAPVGLQLGAQTPAEIALAIVAEIQSVLTASHVAPLRTAPGAIHPRAVDAE
jgi:xanthine/CO dehydrogenase XdhC/CoxF family maturation factor